VTDATHPRRVLVAAATADEADSLRTLLAVWGCDVRTATDGSAAVAAAEAFAPNLALLDLRLNGPDGYEVARRLRGTPGLESTTLVAMAGHDAAAHRVRTLADGFHHFLTIPIDPEALRRIAAR
jgi:two-component system, sensor histidine kinase